MDAPSVRFDVVLGLVLFSSVFASHVYGSPPPANGDSVFQVQHLDFESLRDQTPGRPTLSYSHFNETDGLLAVFSGRKGKRVMLWADTTPNGMVIARAFHIDQESGELKQIFTTAPRDIGNPRSKYTYWLAGTDILTLLDIKRVHRGIESNEERNLKSFLRSDEGHTLMQAIGALYVAFDEPSGLYPNSLLTPFGAIRMAVEVSTGQAAGLDDAVAVVDESKARRMRSRCMAGRCQYRGQHFSILNNGMLDILSDPVTIKSPPANCVVPSALTTYSLGQDVQPLLVQFAGGDDCFGMCGPGCISPMYWGSVWTEECEGHDNCVSQFGLGNCVFETPTNCVGPCATFMAAIESFIVAILEVATVGTWSTGGPYHSPEDVGLPFCTLSIYCRDTPSGPQYPDEPY